MPARPDLTELERLIEESKVVDMVPSSQFRGAAAALLAEARKVETLREALTEARLKFQRIVDIEPARAGTMASEIAHAGLRLLAALEGASDE